jgi:arylsulfatase A-like enzyme
MTDYLGREAVRAIEANRNRPFFMYLAFNAPHTPLQALKSDYDALSAIKDHRLRVYGAMIRALDRNVGLVLDALKAQGLEENTLVIFTSDNGGANYIGLPDINKPFRGWKATFFEGGIHVPFFMRWPAKLPKAARYDQPVGHVDIFSTAAAAAAAETPKDRVLDGVDLTTAVADPAKRAPHKSLFWRDNEYKVLLAGDWKLQVSERPKKIWLHNLRDDPTEQKNLADAMPAKVAELRAELHAIDAQQAKPLWPTLLEAPVRIDRPLGSPTAPGDEFIYWAN